MNPSLLSDSKTVSVVIVNHNAGDLLPDCVRRALDETFEKLENSVGNQIWINFSEK